MSKIVVRGGKALRGSVQVQGAKNAVLPILAATVLNGDENIIHNCPALSDVEASVQILECLGCQVRRQGDTLICNSKGMCEDSIPDCLMREMRSSVIFLGAVAARCGRARITLPGGCELGPRPIDLHLKALRQLGMTVDDTAGIITCTADAPHAAPIHLDVPSVGATENVMLAASGIDGVTTITNAAREPEIEDLQNYLNKIGACVQGAGTATIRIEGRKQFHQAEHSVIADRIVAATYLCAAVLTGGSVELRSAVPEHVQSVLSVLRDCGAAVFAKEDRIIIDAPKRIMPLDVLRTYPYPGFPTDAQALMMAVLAKADGTSMIVENIFENRYKHVEELCRMGADIMVDGRVAVVKGVSHLTGAHVTAMDLRGGAALAIAAMAAEGVSEITEIRHIERGYENFTECFSSLGANIKKIN